MKLGRMTVAAWFLLTTAIAVGVVHGFHVSPPLPIAIRPLLQLRSLASVTASTATSRLQATAADDAEDSDSPQSPTSATAATSSTSSSTTLSSSSSVQVQRLANSAVSIEIPVPAQSTQAAYDKVCRELSKNIAIPGFRKGAKIPPAVLEQNMAANNKGGRNAIKVQAINELVTQLVEPALREQALDPIGQPRLAISAEEMATTFVPGQAMTLSIQCDVWPEIHWTGPYTELTGTYQRKPLDDTKLQVSLGELKERYVTLEPITDSNHVLQLGEACTVNMVGYMATASGTKGEPLPNAASGDRVEVVLGPGRYMEGLVEGLIGAKVGETVQVSVSFPEVS
jgi:trigger factor